MLQNQPYALVIDRDEETRGQLTAALREAGFVVAGFGECRAALAALKAGSVDLAVIAGYFPDGGDALAAARTVRHCQSESRVLFIGAAGSLPGDFGPDDSRAITRPFDKRRFLGAVLAAAAREGDAACRDEAELGLVEAELACLQHRRTSAGNRFAASDVANDVDCQIRDALAARQALRRALDTPLGAD